jgi:hypothetical protein
MRSALGTIEISHEQNCAYLAKSRHYILGKRARDRWDGRHCSTNRRPILLREQCLHVRVVYINNPIADAIKNVGKCLLVFGGFVQGILNYGTGCIRKKKSRSNGGLRRSSTPRLGRVHPVGDAGTRARYATCEQTCVCKATSMRTPRTLRTAGITRERERPGVDIPSARTAAYGIPGVAEVKASM